MRLFFLYFLLLFLNNLFRLDGTGGDRDIVLNCPRQARETSKSKEKPTKQTYIHYACIHIYILVSIFQRNKLPVASSPEKRIKKIQKSFVLRNSVTLLIILRRHRVRNFNFFPYIVLGTGPCDRTTRGA